MGKSAQVEDEQEWCEHITRTHENTWIWEGRDVGHSRWCFVHPDWKVCPVCSKPRPLKEEDRRLLDG